MSTFPIFCGPLKQKALYLPRFRNYFRFDGGLNIRQKIGVIGIKNSPSQMPFEFNIPCVIKYARILKCPIQGLAKKIDMPVSKKVIM
jgi:hypothetical protein